MSTRPLDVFLLLKFKEAAPLVKDLLINIENIFLGSLCIIWTTDDALDLGV